MKVLYVDGDEAYATSLCDALETHDELSVEHVADETSALERLRADAFDCVLAARDPEQTGGGTLRQRVREAAPAVPVVLVLPPEGVATATTVPGEDIAGWLVRREPESTAAEAASRLEAVVTDRQQGIDYEQVFEDATVGIIVHHPETGDIEAINSWMCELLGYERSELLSMSVGEFSAGEEPYTQEAAEAHIRRAATEGPQTFEWIDERADGEHVWVEVSLRRTVFDGRDRVLAVVRDITNRKEHEAALERQTERLEEFASVVSHDLRSPLSVARGWVDYARDEEGEADEALERIGDALERMGDIIDDSLTLAREGRSAEETEPVPVTDVVERWWAVADTADADLTVESPFTVEADPNRLRQVFENLFQNVVRHAPAESGDGDSAGDPTVRVGRLTATGSVDPTVGSVDGDGTVEGFYVEDDGPGIPADEREAVFEAGHTTAPDGTGLGLAIVRRVADAHGWAIRVCESDDGGARFEFLDVDLREQDGGS